MSWPGRVQQSLAVLAAGIAGIGREPGQNSLGNQFRVSADPDGDRLGQADAIGVDVDLNNFRVLWPVVDAIAGKRRKWIESGAERQHDVGLGNEFHSRLCPIVAERTPRKPVTAREAVVVLV